MNRFGFISLEGHIIKLSDVSYVSPIVQLDGLETKPTDDPMQPAIEKFHVYSVMFTVGVAQESYADRDRSKVENFRTSLLTSLEVDEARGAFPSAPKGLDKSITGYKKVEESEPTPSAEPAVQQPPTQ